MSMARRPSPFGELLSLRQAMDRLFEDSYVRSRGVPYGSVEAMALPLDIYSTPEALVVEAALPGVKPDDVEITVLGNTLTIGGVSYDERATERADFMYQELRRGTFSRTVALPSNLDTHQSMATFENGMLRLSIPKAPEAKPRQIRITQTPERTSDDNSTGTDIGESAEGSEGWADDGATGQGSTDWTGAQPGAQPAEWQEPGTPQAAQWEPAPTGNDDWQGGGTSGEWHEPDPGSPAETQAPEEGVAGEQALSPDSDQTRWASTTAGLADEWQSGAPEGGSEQWSQPEGSDGSTAWTPEPPASEAWGARQSGEDHARG